MNTIPQNTKYAGDQQERLGNGHFHPLSVLSRRRMQLFACLLLVCGIALVATMFRKTEYESSACIRVVPTNNLTGARTQSADQWQEFFSTQVEMFKSRNVITCATNYLSDAGYSWGSTEEDLERLEGSVRLNPLSVSGLIDVVAVSENPEEAAAIANAMVEAFIEISSREQAESTAQLRSRLSAQIARYDDEITAQADAVQSYREEHQIVGNDNALPAVQQRISMLEDRLTQVQMRRMELEGERDRLQDTLSRGQLAASSELSMDVINSHPTVVALQHEITLLQQTELRLAQAYLPSHPQLRDTRLRLAEMESRLLERKWHLMAADLARVTEEYEENARQEQTLAVMLSQEQANGVALTAHQAEYEALNESLDTLRTFRDNCVRDLRTQSLNDEISDSPVLLVEAARVPKRPAGLSKEHQIAAILLLGLVFSVTFVFVLDRFATDEPRRSQSDSNTVYIPVPSQAWGTYSDVFGPKRSEQPDMTNESCAIQLGQIDVGGKSQDSAAFRVRCRVVHADQQSSSAGVFRSLTTQLLNRFGNSRQSLVVTGPQSASGKTTCACNLAMMLAGSGRRVLLVEASQSRPALSKVFGDMASEHTMLEIANDPSLIDNNIASTDVENLYVLTAQMSDAVISARQAGTLNNALLEGYDWVIYDSSNLEAALTQSLLAGVGKALLVSTSQDMRQTQSAINAVENCGSMSVGNIANCFGYVSSGSGVPTTQSSSSAKQAVST